MREFETLAEMKGLIGQEVAVSDWQVVTQERIDKFAEATGDFQWIHVDPERSAKGPFGTTIAHGFLTLSMLAQMAYQVCPAVEGTKSGVNYGFNRLRFVAPVPTGSRVRGRFRLKDFEIRPAERWQATWDVSVEVEGGTKPAIAAEWLNAGFF